MTRTTKKYGNVVAEPAPVGRYVLRTFDNGIVLGTLTRKINRKGWILVRPGALHVEEYPTLAAACGAVGCVP